MSFSLETKRILADLFYNIALFDASFHFNNIIVMEDGAIIEQGTHDSLISGNGYYAELYHHQVSGEKESGK